MSHKRDQCQDAAGRSWQSRLYPSAGGTHCIEPLLYLHDNPAPWRRFNRTNEALEAVRFESSDALLSDVLDATRRHEPPPIILFAIADPDLLGSRYPGGSSLMWRDAGSFLTIAHLVVTSYATSSTIVGTCTELRGLQHSTPPFAIGALAIGGPTWHRSASPSRSSTAVRSRTGVDG